MLLDLHGRVIFKRGLKAASEALAAAELVAAELVAPPGLAPVVRKRSKRPLRHPLQARPTDHTPSPVSRFRDEFAKAFSAYLRPFAWVILALINCLSKSRSTDLKFAAIPTYYTARRIEDALFWSV